MNVSIGLSTVHLILTTTHVYATLSQRGTSKLSMPALELPTMNAALTSRVESSRSGHEHSGCRNDWRLATDASTSTSVRNRVPHDEDDCGPGAVALAAIGGGADRGAAVEHEDEVVAQRPRLW